jgi:hypothetical protein
MIRPAETLALPGEGSGTPDTAIRINPVFGDDFGKGLYRAVLDISGNHLTGFVFIKKTSDSSFRILFSNDFGMQYFDFEFLKDKFIVHNCFPALNRKSLLKLLEADFTILLFPDHGIKKISQEKNKNKEEKSYSLKNNLGKWFFTISASTDRILAIGSSGKFFSKTRINLVYSTELVTAIDISNPMIKLHFSMNQISR